ncbi:MAG: helix-turn-helix domain-containing protein [Verrucomicrobia bacterium]|nr:helix-turn-helix domain-containing protein [Verrucomicrobiota bacterium]
MSTDYRKLCLELWGTDDINELKRIAGKETRKNPRGAGRKKKFRASDVHEMEQLLQNGLSIQEIAKRYNSSRQVVGRYLTPAWQPGCTLRLVYMYRQFPCTFIDLDFMERKLWIHNRTDDMLHRAFGANEQPSWQDYQEFLKERCFPATRGNAKSILKELGLLDYDPLQIVEKTQGRLADDDMWVKFCYPKEYKTCERSK